MSIKKIYDEHFETWIYAAYGVPVKEFVKFVNRSTTRPIDKTSEKQQEGNAGCVRWGWDMKTKRRIIFLWTKRKDVSHLVHEIMHVVLEFGNYFGTIKDETTKDQEATAMFAQFLARKITEKEGRKHGRVHKKKA